MIACDQICKRFGDRRVLEDVSFTIERGTFSILLGPSGCGKTLLLSILAGLESPSSGRVLIGGSDMTLVPPERRPVTMVFQRHALFPHLTVFENIAFSMRARHLPQGVIRSRVEDLLGLIDLASYRHAKPDVLSGGQCQRVALARALASDAEGILFDEPLSSLDAATKAELMAELKRMQRVRGFTALYVTHDRDEALALGDRLFRLEKGRLAQAGAPKPS